MYAQDCCWLHLLYRLEYRQYYMFWGQFGHIAKCLIFQVGKVFAQVRLPWNSMVVSKSIIFLSVNNKKLLQGFGIMYLMPKFLLQLQSIGEKAALIRQAHSKFKKPGKLGGPLKLLAQIWVSRAKAGVTCDSLSWLGVQNSLAKSWCLEKSVRELKRIARGWQLALHMTVVL